MGKIRLFVLIVLGLVALSGLFYFVVGSLKPKVAGIYIDSSPPSSVLLNSSEVGITPYRGTIKPGETVVKLVPESFGVSLKPYETKVNLIAGVETVIRYDFGENAESSAGEIISFEKNERGETNLVAVSIPDSIQLIIDGRERSFTPHKTSSVLPGEHELKFTAQGYAERKVKVKMTEGYKLTAIVKLSKLSLTPTPFPTPVPTQYKEEVEILSTGTGFLRVRSVPSTQGDEVGRVNPGERYPFVSSDPKTGWYEIEFEPGKSGWISNQYAKRFGSGSLTPTPNVATSSAQKSPTPTTQVVPQ